MDAFIPKITVSFITVLLLLCYSISLTSCGLSDKIKKAVKVVQNINNATGCRLCYFACKEGWKKFIKKTISTSQYDGCVKICKTTCNCEL
jgi:NAD-dependent dihydropyrimidine dehydrogenase PreA subunit